MTVPAFGSFGWQEILLLTLAIVLLFGATKIPKLMRGLGQGMTEFRKGLRGEEEKTPHAAETPEGVSKVR